MDRRRFIKLSGLAGMVTLVLPSGIVHAFSPEEFSGLDQSFFNPADAARPYTMWFWMNGHVTKEGITNDLEAMKRVGIGGVFNFDAGTGIPKGPIEYLSPAWLELKKHAVNEAARLGLAFTMHNCPGWSSSGGPWITPDKAMQQLTWSETFIQGGKTAKLRLPKPFHKHDYYREIAVLAYPSLAHEAQLDELVSKITSATGAVKLKSIKESDYTLVTRTAGNQAWLQFEFKKPFKARSLSFITSRAEKDSDGFVGEEEIVLEASDNGKEFKELYKIRIHSDAVHHERVKSVEIDFPEVQATFFRLRTDHDRAYSQIHFSGIHKFEDWRKRANFQYNGTGKKELTDPAGDVVPVKDIIDVTPYMSAEGELNWSAPEGRWTILRIGFTPVGEVNHAAPDSGLGLECDKYSQEAITFHFNKMMDILLPAIGPLVKKGQMGLEIDSYEVGMQNWTPGFERIFKERNHYDIIQYLPAMTGRIVSDIETTDRVLWDLRRTQADLLADNYYGKFDQLCNDRGIISFIQPYDRGPMEEMQIGSRADSLMGEFWNGLSSIFQNNLMMKRTCKLASSMAHVNAQKITGAEAFTGEPESARWQEYPFMMKAVGDKAFSNGINRMIIHRFAHQAYENALPGMTMGPWGIHFDRTNTWWEQGSGWLKYLTRCQSLLQQGLFVADLAYFTGEDPGVYTIVNREELNPIPPTGYDYDLINAEVLLNKAKVINSRLVLPDGMSYRILVLQSYKTISIDLLKKIEGFINDGLTVVGAPPSGTPGLNSKESEAEFAEIIRRIWGEPQNIVDRNLGKGRVFWGQPMSEILNLTGLQCDFEFTSESGDAPVLYLHRTIDNQEVYFMTNQRRKTENIVAEFRVENKKPEIWDALSGTILHAPVYEATNGRVKLPVTLPPYGSLFVVFREKADTVSIKTIAKDDIIVSDTERFPVIERKLYPEVKDNFTISFWAKPELQVMLSTDNFMEYVKDPWTDYYAVYPASGNALYGKGHFTAGLAVGRNGVAVWEHGENPPVMVLAASEPISGWSHIALVYKQGTPSVYVNGRLIKKGDKAGKNIHPGTGPAYLNEGASYYNGDMTEPQLNMEVLSEEKIKEIASRTFEKKMDWIKIVEPVQNKVPSLLFRENGEYTLTDTLGKSKKLTVAGINEPVFLDGSWDVYFPPAMGAPEKITLPRLTSLHLHQESGVKYFSGTATYTKSFTLATDAIAQGKHIFLDLGGVEVIAEVIVNGKNLGILWSRPYMIEITGALKIGVNEISIKVTNQWVNRLIGDEQLPDEDKFVPGAGSSGFAGLIGGAIEKLPEWYLQGKPKPENGRVTFTTWKHYRKDSPLLESGLIGPVILRSAVSKKIV